MRLQNKGEDLSIIRDLVITLIAIALLIAIIYGLIKSFSGKGEKYECFLGGFFEAYVRDPYTRAVIFDYKCPTSRVTVEMKELDKEPIIGNKVKELDYWKKYDFNDQEKKRKYNLNRIVAQEMRDCWFKGGEGKMPIAENWWWSLGKEDPEEDHFWEFWNWEYKGPPTFCILCSRIKFEGDVKNIYPDGSKDDLDDFLKNQPLPTYVETDQFSYLLDPKYGHGIAIPHYEYSTNEPLAVVYARINVHRLIELVQTPYYFIKKDLLGFEGDKSKPVDAIMLFPFDEIYRADSKIKRCSVVMNLE